MNFIKKLFKASHLEIYTDGSFKEGRGAWAYVLVKNNKVVAENSKLVKKTSSNRMEFQAAIEALSSLPGKTRARLYTDSSILIDAVTRWAPIWETHDWEKENGSAIPNVDLIKTLHELNQKHRIEWKWVKAHSGIEFNERCDELCIRARVEV